MYLIFQYHYYAFFDRCPGISHKGEVTNQTKVDALVHPLNSCRLLFPNRHNALIQSITKREAMDSITAANLSIFRSMVCIFS